MLKTVKVINWIMLIIGILGFLGLSSDPTIQDAGSGFIVTILWIAQSIINLVLISKIEKGEL